MAMRRAAIVTGASSGIGLAVARALVEDGYGVALAARRADLLGEIAARLGKAAVPIPTDVSCRTDVDRLVRTAVGLLGRIDVVVANAGIGTWAPLEDIEEDTWDKTIAVNLKGAYLLARAALPHLRSSRGHLIAISSVAGKIGIANSTAYSASKWGLLGFVESFLQETRADGVRATSICPGKVGTPMLGLDEATEDVISVDDIVETVRWLLRLRPVVQVREIVLERTLA